MPVAVRPVLALDFTMTAAVSENVPYVAARPLIVVDFHNQCTVVGAGSTSQLQRQPLGVGGFNDVTAALVMEVADALTRTADLISPENTVAVTDVLRVAFVSAIDGLGRAWARFTPIAIPGQ